MRSGPRSSFVPLQADDDEAADAVTPAQMHPRRLADVNACVSRVADKPRPDRDDAIAGAPIGAADRDACGEPGRLLLDAGDAIAKPVVHVDDIADLRRLRIAARDRQILEADPRALGRHGRVLDGGDGPQVATA